jgi:hypothetical protein
VVTAAFEELAKVREQLRYVDTNEQAGPLRC